LATGTSSSSSSSSSRRTFTIFVPTGFATVFAGAAAEVLRETVKFALRSASGQISIREGRLASNISFNSS
jgi:hypothetical protein